MKKTNQRETIYCEKGHGYDPKEHKLCPYCYGEEANKAIEMTRGAIQEEIEDLMPTEKAEYVEDGVKSDWMDEQKWSWDDDDVKTVSVFVKEKGVDPVVGWLVALSGKTKGCDYRIHSENNYIGRSPKMDICIKEDDAVSKENHASIAFDTRSKKFYFTPCNARNIVHINDNAIFTTTELAAYDIIELGLTKFVFIPFCGEEFDWTELLEA